MKDEDPLPPRDAALRSKLAPLEPLLTPLETDTETTVDEIRAISSRNSEASLASSSQLDPAHAEASAPPLPMGTTAMTASSSAVKRPSPQNSTDVFKVPSSPSKRQASALNPRPPLLVVDTSIIEEANSPPLPRTPANVRMNNPTELHNAVCMGQVAQARALLEEGHAIDPIEEHGFTPLHKASALDKEDKRLALVELLLEHGADVLRGDKEGYTPLHWAAALGHSNVLVPMLRAGAAVTQRSFEGETALHRAARFGRLECAKLLVGKHGDPKAVLERNKDFLTPLDVAGMPLKRINRQHRMQLRRALLESAPSARTLVLHHPDCMLHETGDLHQEHPLRLEAILTYVHASQPHPPAPPAAAAAASSAAAAAASSAAAAAASSAGVSASGFGRLGREEAAAAAAVREAAAAAIGIGTSPGALPSTLSAEGGVSRRPSARDSARHSPSQAATATASDAAAGAGGAGGGHGGGHGGGAAGAGGSHHTTRAGTPVTWELPPFEVIELCNFEPATHEALQRVHEPSYIQMVQSAALLMQKNAANGHPPPSPMPLTPMVQLARGAKFEALKDPRTCDTRLSAGSYAAARRAAGAVCRAIDEVMRGNCRNALCVVRPPGHHAGVQGLIPGSTSCGFCVFNSVMVGAAHALQGPLRVPRVAIVDFDVHHGDGSEEIVRALAHTLPPNALFFCSIHLYDPGDASFGAFYPGSGAADDLSANVLNVPVAPLWRKSAIGKGGGGRPTVILGGSAPGASPKCACWGCGRAEWRSAFSQVS